MSKTAKSQPGTNFGLTEERDFVNQAIARLRAKPVTHFAQEQWEYAMEIMKDSPIVSGDLSPIIPDFIEEDDDE